MEHYLGQKLKQLRQSRGWSQEDLAKKLNRGASTISGYETDAHAIPSNVLISIAEIFGVSLNELVNLNEPDAVSLKDLTTSQAETLIALRKAVIFLHNRCKFCMISSNSFSNLPNLAF